MAFLSSDDDFIKTGDEDDLNYLEFDEEEITCKRLKTVSAGVETDINNATVEQEGGHITNSSTMDSKNSDAMKDSKDIDPLVENSNENSSEMSESEHEKGGWETSPTKPDKIPLENEVTESPKMINDKDDANEKTMDAAADNDINSHPETQSEDVNRTSNSNQRVDEDSFPTLNHVNESKRILLLKNVLEKQGVQLLTDLVSLDNHRLVLQESSLLAQSKVLQQRRMLLHVIDDISNERYREATKYVDNGMSEIDNTTKGLEKRNSVLQDTLVKLKSLETTLGDISNDVFEDIKKVIEVDFPKTDASMLSCVEFVQGEINIASLATMIGLLQSTALDKNGQNTISTKIVEEGFPGIHIRSLARDVSVESSSTQISSNDLSDHFSVSTQTNFDGDKGFIGPAEGYITLSVNVDDIEESLDRSVESMPIDVLGLSWRVVVVKHWRDQLQIRLYYKNLEFIEKCVEYVEYGYTFKLLNHHNDTWTVCKKESHKIGRDAWWDNVIGWSRLEDPKNGYVRDKWFTVEAKVSVTDVKMY